MGPHVDNEVARQANAAHERSADRSAQDTINSLNFFSLYPELYDAAEEEVRRVGYRNSPAYALAMQSFHEWLEKGERFRKRLNQVRQQHLARQQSDL
jgi:hypothetical protein